VFDAVLEQLGAQGYERLSVAEVAAAAGMNKTSLYRRWPTKGELVLAALEANREGQRATPLKGNLRADLLGLLERKAKALSTPQGRAIGRALMAMEEDHALAASIRRNRYALPTSVVQAAIERGEIAKVDAAFVSELLLAPVLHRLLVTGRPVNRAFLVQVVDHVVGGLAKKQR
jgi:AcrR family transcriptional regulator